MGDMVSELLTLIEPFHEKRHLIQTLA